MSSINWNVELAKLEREFDGRRPKPTAGEIRQHRAVREQSDRRASNLAVWARLILVGALAGALGFWPYTRECGWGLYTFMGAAAMVLVGGVWVSICTWRHRLAIPHVLAFLLVLGGIGVVAHEVLPRVGYARVDPSRPLRWSCPARLDPATR